tara:strand:+ start:1471 stop:2325 length:855 start_codon:yes stop_codon:yes gene_type:complete
LTIFHVGFPKAASSTLQYNVFPHLEDYSFFNPVLHAGHEDMDEDPVFVEIMKLLYEGNEEYDPANIRRLFEAHEGQEQIISSEGFTGYDGNMGLRAERAVEAFSGQGAPKVLFVLRNQWVSLRSFYKQNAARTHLVPWHFDHVEWSQWLWYHTLPGHRYTGVLPMFNYEPIIRYYETLFGRENVNVLLFEKLVRSPLEFAEDLGEVLRVDPANLQPLLSNDRANQGPKTAKKRVLPFFPATLLGTADEMAFGKYEEGLRSLYAEGNHALADRYDLPLADLNYPM